MQQYAIVDIETTGSYAAGAGITEIAILLSDGQQVTDEWSTLINPLRPIPRFIQSLTGITNDMVEGAPTFDDVAREVRDRLLGHVFVAHNVNFDYSFVKHHLDQAGYRLDARKLCTVRLARKVAPGLRSYSLGRLCTALDIEHREAHRAMGDAAATARLLHHLIANDTGGHRDTMLKGRNKEQYLPPALPADQVADLPECPGVYYFLNAAGKVIYVGKAINLRKRVKSHFANNKTGRQKADFLREIVKIRHEPTASDLMAQILESVEIRRLWPIYNRSQRGYHPRYGLYTYEDRQGYQRLALDSHKPHIKPAHTFNTLHEGNNWLRRLTEEFALCPRLCNLAKDADCDAGRPSTWCPGACPAHGPAEDYNAQVEDAVKWIARALPTMALVMEGRDDSERSCILMERGQFYGMGYLPNDGSDVHDLAALKQQLTPYPDNNYIRILVYKWAQEHPEQCVQLG